MANQFSVQPLGGLQNVQMIGQGMQGIAQNVQQQREQERQRQVMQQAQQVLQSGNPREMAAFSLQNPEVGKQLQDAFGFTNEQTKPIAISTYQRALANPDQAAQILQQGIQDVSAAGGRPTNMMRDLQLLQENPEAGMQVIEMGFAGVAPDVYEQFYGAQAETVAPSNVREYEYYNSLSPEDQRRYLAMKRSGQTFRQGDVTMAVDPRTQTTAQPITEAGAAPTTQAEAQQQLTEQEATKAASTKAAEQAIAESGKAFEQLRPIKTAIANVDEAIRLIDEGAQTGVIASRLPSVQEASIALDNLQGRLGLDVIGNTTFGALSEAELRFALDTALPKNLEGPALKRWLQEKQESQKKLAEYLEDAATFLGRPGNTIADFLDKQRGESGGGGMSEQDADAFINSILGQ